MRDIMPNRPPPEERKGYWPERARGKAVTTAKRPSGRPSSHRIAERVEPRDPAVEAALTVFIRLTYGHAGLPSAIIDAKWRPAMAAALDAADAVRAKGRPA